MNALRLKPDYAKAHYNLGFAMEQKGDLRTALTQYRIAYELDPSSSKYRAGYEKLLQIVKSRPQKT